MGAIDIGPEAIARASLAGANQAFINKDNPANADGKITSIEVYARNNLSGFKVGIFYVTNGNTLKCRSAITIGAVTSGSKQTFTEDEGSNPINMDVVAGDYIGCWCPGGNLEADTAGFAGYWYAWLDTCVVDDERAYTWSANRAVSLKGIGAEVAVDVTVEPPLATIASAGQAPTFSIDRIFGAPLAAVAVAGLIPVIEPITLIEPPLATINAAGLAPSIVATFVYVVDVDWDVADWRVAPDFSQGIDNISGYVKAIRVDRGKKVELGNIPSGILDLTLNNEDKRFSPTYSESPLYGKMRPWLPVRVRALVDGSLQAVYAGFISRISVNPDRNVQEAYLYCTDGMDLLARNMVSVDKASRSMVTDGAAIGHILDGTGWPSTKRSLDVDGGSIVNYPTVTGS